MENLKKESPWQTTDEHIKQVLASLAGRIREEEESRYGEIARTIAKEYDRDEREMDTDTFAALISFDIIEKLHKQLTLKFFPQYAQNRKILFAIQHYDFIKSHVTDMIAERSCCTADVSRWLIKQYIAYLQNPLSLPDMTQTTPDGKTCFWKPSFGTAEEWMAFCEALEELYYGHSEAFFLTRDKLLPNDPLTSEELREMNGDKVCIHYIDGFYTDEDGVYFGRLEQLVRECNGRLTTCELPLEFCGKTWLAYRRKPEEGTT